MHYESKIHLITINTLVIEALYALGTLKTE